MRAARDERRTAHLLFDEELASGRVRREEVERRDVLAELASRPMPSPPARVVQRLALRSGRLTLAGDVVGPLMRARKAVLGDAAFGEPRILVRVDEVPHAEAADDPERYGVAMSRRFHAVLRDAGVPSLAAVLTRLAHRPYVPSPALGDRALTDEEVALLRELHRDGVAFGVHGHTHRTRHASPRRRSELTGLRRPELDALLDRAHAVLGDAGLDASVFVPPFNRFARRQWAWLAARYDVVCGGPESVALVGFHPGPAWRGDAVWLPSYHPLYGRARDVAPAVDALREQGAALWLCVTLHPGWELDDDHAGLRDLAARIAPVAARWEDFLAAVARSRAAA